jgi:hypothetical protein
MRLPIGADGPLEDGGESRILPYPPIKGADNQFDLFFVRQRRRQGPPVCAICAFVHPVFSGQVSGWA